MKALFSQKPSYVVMSLSLLIFVACGAEDPASGTLRLSKQERDEIIKYPEVSYAYLGRELSDIGQLVGQISDLHGNNRTQGIHELRDHMNTGFKIGQCDAVVAVLTEALVTLGNDIKSEKLAIQLKDIIERLQSGELNVEVTQRDLRMQSNQAKENDGIYSQLQAQGIPIVIEEEEVTRDPVIETIEGCLEVTNDALIERNLTVGNDLLVKNDATVRRDLVVKNELEVDDKAKFKNKLTVSGKAKFKKDTIFKRDVDIDGDLLVDNNLEVFGDTELKNVEVGGDLSVVDDLVVCGDTELKGSVVDVACDLVVGCNILMNDTNSPVGNIFKNGTRFIHNFGTRNTFVGKEAGNFTMAGCDNTAIGERALANNITGEDNTAIGENALKNNTTGCENTAVGEEALEDNTTGKDNTAVGSQALKNNTIGNCNTAVGEDALENNTIGNFNTAVGEDALAMSRGRNIGFGQAAGASLTSGDDNIYIGSDSGAATESDQIRIGSSQTDCFIQGIHGATVDSLTDLPVFVDSDGKLGTTASSRKYKSNIIDMNTFSDSLMDLRPVQFTYKHDTSNNLHYGLIAEEVAEMYPELVVRDNSGNTYSIRYHELPAMLLNELQKNRELIKTLQSKDQSNTVVVEELKNTIQNLLTEQHKSNTFIKELLTRIIALEELIGKKLL